MDRVNELSQTEAEARQGASDDFSGDDERSELSRVMGLDGDGSDVLRDLAGGDGKMREDMGWDGEEESLMEELESNVELGIVRERHLSIKESAVEFYNKAVNIFSRLEGADLISSYALQNILRQGNLLAEASIEISKKGFGTIAVFGEYMTFYSIEEIENLQNIILGDFEEMSEISDDIDVNSKRLLGLLDRYLFDGRNFEIVKDQPVSILLMDNPEGDLDYGFEKNGLLERLKKQELIKDYSSMDAYYEGDIFKDDDGVGFMYLSRFPIGRILENDRPIPDVVAMHIKSPMDFRTYHNTYQQLFVDYWEMEPEKRPIVIMYFDGFEPPLYIKHDYEGFLFCSNEDDLRNTIYLAKDLKASKEKPDFMNPINLADAQERLYDNSDLREWEGETADTYLSLKHLFEIIQDREDRSKRADRRYQNLFNENSNKIERHNPWDLQVRTVVDFGTGEGRISGMLARLGINVMGIDISQTQLDRIPERLRQEGEGLRNEGEDDSLLSYNALLRLKKEDLIPDNAGILFDDEEALNHIVSVKGDFMNLHGDLHRAVAEWDRRFPEIDRNRFFNLTGYEPYAFSFEHDMFTDAGFDMALFNWHTFCEVGSVDNMKEVLRQVLNVLDRGGLLVIEIPDRTVGPYAKSLEKYHEENPSEPYGTIRDSTSTEEGVSSTVGENSDDTARYFPDRDELVQLLRFVGFEIKPQKDVQSYLITKKGEDGKQHLQSKELFIVAQKSWE